MDRQNAYCKGCRRTLDEIAEWSTASEARKRAIWEALARRGAAEQREEGA